MTARPVLGIICCNRMVGAETAQAVMDRYVRSAMTYADVAALLIPSLPELMTAVEVAPRLDGILLTGSPSNIEAARYSDDSGDGPFDPSRDEIALNMVGRMMMPGNRSSAFAAAFRKSMSPLAARCAEIRARRGPR